MSIRTAIYQRLAQDTELVTRLAKRPSSVGGGPAIYEAWAAPDSAMPYINLTYQTAPGNHEYKRVTTLNIDLFASTTDSTVPEAISNHIQKRLHMQPIYTADDGLIRMYLDNELELLDDSPGVSHWNITFTVIHWPKSLIEFAP